MSSFLGIPYIMIESSLVGTFATFIGLGLSNVLDKKVGQETSNAIGLVIESLIDGVGQKYVFDPNNPVTESMTIKFIISKILAIFVTQALFMMVLWNFEKKVGFYTLQIIRLSTAALSFFVVTYPLRKYWVFKVNKKKVHVKDHVPDHAHDHSNLLLHIQ